MTVAVAETNSKPRGGANLTPAQKQASALRRDASMLERLAAGSSNPEAMLAQAAQYKAQADTLAPPKANGDSTPTTLTEAEWNAVETYFLTDLRVRLREGFSAKKLKAIAALPTA